MIFTDLSFLYLFLPLCLILYFVTKKQSVRNAVLTVFSLIFYAWGDPVGIIALIISTAVNYLNGILADNKRNTSHSTAVFVWSWIFNIAVLAGFFAVGKYFQSDISASRLPIGAFVFSLQGISYTADCCKGKIKPQRSFFKFLMYMSLFPQLGAGQILRYEDIEKQIDDRKTTVKDFSWGISKAIIGLGKTVIIADNLYPIIHKLFSAESIKTLTLAGAWYGCAVSVLWFYFAFSGFSDIAIGLGRIFGFKIKENFRHPLAGRTVSGFWQRCYVSLVSFFRDYFLLPIFGKKANPVGLLVMWLCIGLWLDRTVGGLIFGAYFGFFILLEALIGKKRMKKIPTVLSHILSKLVIIVGFGIFPLNSLGSIGAFFKALAGQNNGLAISADGTLFMQNIFLLAVAIVFSLPIVPKIKSLAFKSKGFAYTYQTAGIVLNALIIAVCTILLAGTLVPLDYFKF